MIVEWLIREQKKKLLIVCNGWGMDKTVFLPVTSRDYDVLVCSNHQGGVSHEDECGDISASMADIISAYGECVLISWSMGVVYAQQYFSSISDCFAKCIAVNGTLNPIHDDFGIPIKIVTKTLRELSHESLNRFYRRTCKESKILQLFLDNKPQRSLDDQRQELEKIVLERLSFKENDSIYSTVIVSEKDLIIPSSNQLNFWKKSPVLKIAGSHFPFYGFTSWDHFINMV